MATIRQTIDAWHLASKDAQRFKEYLTKSSCDLEKPPGKDFWHIKNEDLQVAGFSVLETRMTILRKLAQGGEHTDSPKAPLCSASFKVCSASRVLSIAASSICLCHIVTRKPLPPYIG